MIASMMWSSLSVRQELTKRCPPPPLMVAPLPEPVKTAGAPLSAIVLRLYQSPDIRGRFCRLVKDKILAGYLKKGMTMDEVAKILGDYGIAFSNCASATEFRDDFGAIIITYSYESRPVLVMGVVEIKSHWRLDEVSVRSWKDCLSRNLR
jgi:hypothetical protein